MRKDYYFIFKGINSKKYGIEIAKFYPITKPQKNIETISIPGRSNDVHIDYGSYNSYALTIECIINPFSRNKQNIDNIIAWLDGFGDLITSQEPDKIYNAVIFQPFDINDVIWVFPKFLITFNVQPLKKSVNYVNEHIEITKKGIVNNIGTVKSLPKITIYGTGDVTLIVNNDEFTIKNIEEFIVIDSEFLEVYKNNTSQNNKYTNFSFPNFELGKNIVDFKGNVKKIIIEPNWRWI